MYRVLLIIIFLWSSAMAGALDDAQRFYEEGKVAEALQQFELAGQKDPNEVTLLYNLANCHFKLGQLDEAVGLFERVLGQESNSALASKAHFNLGNCALQEAMAQQEGADLKEVLKGLAEAVKHYRETLRIDPEDAEAKHNIALVSQVMGQIIAQIKQQEEQQKQDQEQQEDLIKKIEELLERQKALIQSSSGIGQAEQMAMVDPNFIVNMRRQALSSQGQLKGDSSTVQGEVAQMMAQSQSQTQPPQAQSQPDGSVYETVHQEMGLAVANQGEAVAGLQSGPMVRVVSDQGVAAQHLQNALDALKQEQEQNEDPQDQQDGEDQEESEDSEQQESQDQEGENSDEQQEQQEGEGNEQQEQAGEEGQEQDVKPLDQTAQEILDKEKERQENKRRVIIRGGGGVEKNW